MNKSLRKDARKAANGITGTGSTPVNNLTLGTISTGVLAPSLGGITSISPIFQATQADGPTADEIYAQHQALQQATLDEYKRRYTYLYFTPNEQLFPGFFVSPDGSVFQGTPDSGTAFLAIGSIQDIENGQNTPGQLLLKLNQPAIAKDTAGYAGGSSQTWYESNGVTDPPATQQVADPIPEVQTLPPVTAIVDPASGNVQTVFTDTGSTTLPAGTTATPNGPVSTNEAGMVMPGGKYWWLWYLIAAIAIILFMKFGRK